MSHPVSLDTVVAAVQDQVSCAVGGETVIMNMRNGKYFGLNAVGGKIFELVQRRRSVEEVRDLLLVEYPDVDEERCTRDLIAILSKMIERDLVEVTLSS